MFREVFAIILAISVSVIGTHRTKRIMHGRELKGRSSGYDAVRYYVWISVGNECEVMSPLIEAFYASYGAQCGPEPTGLKCGGSLIAPRVVQTSCRCISRFDRGPRFVSKRRAEVRGTWEHRYRVYIGGNRVSEFRRGLFARAYIVHQQCTQLGVKPFWVLNDFGLILTSRSVNDYRDLQTVPFNFAPMHTMKSLMTMWRHTLNNQLICLYLGFGEYQGYTVHKNSESLRHGWAATLDYTRCHEWSMLKQGISPNIMNYTREATWHCTLPFFRHPFEGPRNGDFGGPVTCDNNYFSIMSAVKLEWMETTRVNIELVVNTALIFSMFENAIEYRGSFMREVERYDGFRTPEGIATFRPAW